VQARASALAIAVSIIASVSSRPTPIAQLKQLPLNRDRFLILDALLEDMRRREPEPGYNTEAEDCAPGPLHRDLLRRSRCP
jgi:hypothetical protein